MALSLKKLWEKWKGSSQPDPTYHTPFMEWVDTSVSPPVLKRRTADNSGWYQVQDSGGTGGASVYRHEQSTPSTTWTITHNLGVKPMVQCFDYTGTPLVMVPASITHNNDNQCTLVFASSLDGWAVCVG